MNNNYVLPDYFFEKVANKLGIRRDDVEKVYNRYLINLSKALETEGNVFLSGLGVITAQPKGISIMYRCLGMLNKNYEKTGILEDPQYIYCFDMIENVWQKMKKVQKKYEYIERGLEKFRSNLGRFEEFFDNEGHYRGSIKKKKVNL